ncbi:MAG TPA: oligoendopeptidase F [Rectinemataceae bacterium]|nr:oligoendopeptidase F [Rectinemataceae bacterium]
MAETVAAAIPPRSELPEEDKWNLSKLFADEESWEKAFREYRDMLPRIGSYKATLGLSAESLREALVFYRDFGALDERLGVYASLRQSEDEGLDASRGRFARYLSAATEAQGAWSWMVPELQALSESFVEACLAEERFAEFAVFVRKLLRFKPHVLGEKEERLLALQTETAQTPHETFSVLTNVDLDFGSLDTPEGPRPLTQSTFSSFMRSPDRTLRRRAYAQFYRAFETHKNTLAALYAGAVKQDAYSAKVRNYPSARAAALFPDDVPETVYDNLVGAVGSMLPVLHEYYELRRRALKLDELRHFDVYVPIVPEVKSRHSYAEAVDLVCRALAPLGEDYVRTIRSGFEGGWVDRYENKGKRSGAFSSGAFGSEPYILLNYKEDVLHDVFTLAHEGGHSMHSWHSAGSNPFLSYGYTIFEAEVASTFNEQLLFHYLYERAENDGMRAFLVNTKLDDLVGTLFRQTMFAEFEARSHAMHESGEPLTVDSLRAEYRKLLEKYFGPAMVFEEASDLECLRIPHFYSAFYVYKYATGISASVALAERVLRDGGREDYFAFLRSGGSRFPIEALKVAGVDMSSPAPVQAACEQFARYAAELKRLLKL